MLANRCGRLTAIGIATGVFSLVFGLAGLVRSQEPSRPKAPSGFADGRRGDVPEGTLEMMTAETDRAIQSGLAWLRATRTTTARSAPGPIAATSP